MRTRRLVSAVVGTVVVGSVLSAPVTYAAPPPAPAGGTPAGRKITVPVRVDRQTGAQSGRPTLDRVEYSLEDGATWVTVKSRKKGGHWEVTVPNPASGFVSLRAAASDGDGNTVTQTITRAYRVK